MRLVVLFSIVGFTLSFYSVDKKSYYDALSSNSLKELENMILQLQKEEQGSLVRSYKGALIAKKASFSKNINEKVKLFKKGVGLLEKEINVYPEEVEYRFLRLTIQENCPKILKYNKNIDEDVVKISEGYGELDMGLKDAIMSYTSTSKILKVADLNK